MAGLAIILLLCCCSLASSQDKTAVDPQNKTEDTEAIIKDSAHPCCRFWLDKEAFDRCCKEYNLCPICEPNWPTKPFLKGCDYMGNWYSIGATMEINAEKCYYLKCCWKKRWWNACPSIQHVGTDECNCCRYKDKLYKLNEIVDIGNCRALNCTLDGLQLISSLEDKPCPAGYTQYKDYCLVVVPFWLSWWEARTYCMKLSGTLLWLPRRPLKPAAGCRLPVANLVDCVGAVWLGVHRTRKRPPPTAENARCKGIDFGEVVKSRLPCTMRLRPLCSIPRVPCNMTDCIIRNGQLVTEYEHSTLIEKIDDCAVIFCENGYPMTFINPECCQVWHNGHVELVTPGTIVVLNGLQCKCIHGTVVCS